MNRWYKPWVAAGKPYRAARPIAEVVAKLKAARPAAAAKDMFGSIGDYAHLTADEPLDHTPYSQTGWPIASAYGIGHATDIPHRPDLGLDCNVIFAHWLAEAKAGRLPWLKYLIWQGKSYSVRNGWQPVDAEGHYDHMHGSSRSDCDDMSIGTFDPLGEDMDTKQDALLFNASSIAGATARMEDLAPIKNFNGATGTPVKLALVAAVKGLQTGQAALLAAVTSLASQVGVDAGELEEIRAAAREGAQAGAEAALTPELLADLIPDEFAAAVVQLLGERQAAAERASADVLDGPGA